MTVTVRDMTEADVQLILDYWYRSLPGFIEAMGVDPAKLPAEDDMRKNLRGKIRAELSSSATGAAAAPKPNGVIVEVDGTAVGMHSLFPVTEGEFGIFHAHIWKPEHRGRGVALRSYPIACRLFADRFDLKKIIFKTPLQNIGAHRVKEKLRIRVIGEEEIGFGIVREGTRARVYELTRDELSRLK